MMRPIHPFPARMAPDLSQQLLRTLEPGSRVIDPMCGSGTVVRQAVEAGHHCVGRDIDPLAVLMARGWTTQVDTYRVTHDAHELVRRAKLMSPSEATPPWRDDATDSFARYWFAPEQFEALGRLAAAISATRFRTRDLMRICFSRLIITKERGASLARDVSHSRPHRVATESSFDVYEGFIRAARLVAKRLEPEVLSGHADVGLGDARKLADHVSGGFDAAVTSPPYLNAIDYLRGHRLSLIWFGHSIAELKATRGLSTGAERAVDSAPVDIEPFVRDMPGKALAERYRGWVRRYARDMAQTLEGLRAVVRPGGSVLLVVGNSMIRGASIDNAGIIVRTGEAAGLDLVEVRSRDIPARRRYLPLPVDGALAQRMREESVITLRVPSA